MSEVVADSEVAQKVTEWLDWDKAGIPPHVTDTRHLNVVVFKLSIHTALESDETKNLSLCYNCFCSFFFHAYVRNSTNKKPSS